MLVSPLVSDPIGSAFNLQKCPIVEMLLEECIKCCLAPEADDAWFSYTGNSIHQKFWLCPSENSTVHGCVTLFVLGSDEANEANISVCLRQLQSVA